MLLLPLNDSTLSFQLGCMFPYFHFHSDAVVTSLKKNSSLLIPACYFSSRFTICHKTEVVKNTLNPVWQPFTIPVRALCNGDYDRYAPNPHVLHTSSSPQLLFILSLLHLAAFIMPLLPPHLHLKTLTSTMLSRIGSSQNSSNTSHTTSWKAAVSACL